MSTNELDGGQESDSGVAEPADGRRAHGWRGVLYRSLMGAFLLVTVVAVALALRNQDWSVLAVTMQSRQPGFFVAMAGLAFLANAAALLAAMLASWSMLSGVNGDVTVVDAARMFFVGQFAKYVPGKVFGLMVSIRMGKTIGVSAVRMSSAWLLTLVVGLLTGATIGLAAGPEVLGGSVGWLALAALPILASLIRPELINQAAGAVARLRRRPPPGVGVSGRRVRQAVVTQLVSWLAGGAHLWFLAVAMGAPPARSILLCVGAFSLGAVVGVFAVFAPDGLGVREGILVAALSVILPLPLASVVALASRLVVILSELTTAGVGLLVTQVLRRRRLLVKTPANLGRRSGDNSPMLVAE